MQYIKTHSSKFRGQHACICVFRNHMWNLRKRGYSNGFINNYSNKVKFLDRPFELKPKIKRQFKKTFFNQIYTLRQTSYACN